MSNFLQDIKWDAQGLVPAIAQDARSGRILMMAWMNPEALQLTVRDKRAVYWSRSRNKLWFKGEQSGNVQIVKDIYLDCDADVLVLKIKQIGSVACHTGRESCFFRKLEGDSWQTLDPVLKDPNDMYGKK